MSSEAAFGTRDYLTLNPLRPFSSEEEKWFWPRLLRDARCSREDAERVVAPLSHRRREPSKPGDWLIAREGRRLLNELSSPEVQTALAEKARCRRVAERLMYSPLYVEAVLHGWKKSKRISQALKDEAERECLA